MTAIVEASPGRLFVGTYGGGLYQLSPGGATSITTEAGISSNTVTSLAFDSKGGLWIGTEAAGLNYLRNDSVRTFSTAEGLPHNRVNDLLIDDTGKVWVGTSSGLATIFEGRADVVAAAELANRHVTALAPDRRSGIWVGTTSGLYHATEGEMRLHSASEGLLGSWVASLHCDAAGTLFVGTLEGLSRIRRDEVSTLRLEGGQAANIVSALLVDRGRSLWVGTETNGLHQLRTAAITNFAKEDGISNNMVYCLEGSRNGGVWIGSYHGDVDYYEQGESRNVLRRSRLNTGRLRALLEDSSGRLWIGSDAALHRLAGGRLLTFGPADGFPNASARVVYEDLEGTVWIGTDGAGLLFVQNDRLVPFQRNAELPSQVVRAIHQDRDGRLWLGTYGGLSYLQNGALHTYTVADGLVHSNVRTIHETPDGTLWIGTYGGGLSRFEDGEFVNYTAETGLHNDAIYDILQDRRGDLWMSSNTGIFRVEMSDLESYASGSLDRIESLAFNETDGMRNRECNGGSPGGLRSRSDNRLWFPTVGGIAVVDPDRLSGGVSAPVVIEGITIDGANIPLSAELTLESGVRRLALEYAALNFLAPEKTLFRYMVHGYDRDWVDAGRNRVAQYTNLQPGNYRFEVQASIREGEWMSQSAELEFYLRPAFYQRWWFYAACVLSLGLIAFASYRRRVYNLKRNQQILQSKVQEALAEVSVLQGLLPICSYCKKIRDDKGYWNQLESYIGRHSNAQFTHSLCPDCLKEHYPEFGEARENRRADEP